MDRNQRIRPIFGVSPFGRLACVVLTTILLCAQTGQALEPTSARGYINVLDFGASNEQKNPHATRLAIQQAINTAFTQRKVVYFPEGTYLIDDKLKCHTWTVNNDPEEENHHVLVGSTRGASRPLIKLAANSEGYNNPNSPKPMLEVKNFNPDIPTQEAASNSYYQMVRGIDFDCNGQTGAYAIYFNQAQDCSLEDIQIDATGAYAGVIGLPGRAWGVVNLEVEGGRYGIDTSGHDSAGAVLAGCVFRNQTQSAIRYVGFVPLTVVGFEIVTLNNSTQAAITIPAHNWPHYNCVNLIDGRITLGGSPSPAAINNSGGQNLYVRNVYVSAPGSGSHNLVKSGSLAAVTGSGQRKLINEYSYTDQQIHNNIEPEMDRRSRNLIDGVLSTTAQPVASVSNNVGAPPEDLVLRHRWASLPAIDDLNTVEAWNGTTVKGDSFNNDLAGLQAVIDNNRGKPIFLRPGRYMLRPATNNSPGLILHSDTILFGAARHLTQVTHLPAWKPTQETPLITTVNDVNATTYIGDMVLGYHVLYSAIGGPNSESQYSWFNMLDWKAGANSTVHTGRPFTIPEKGGYDETQGRALLKVSGNGGGRWFFPGCGEVKGVKHPNFRTFRAANTTQPLWIYGLNPEHEQSSTYTEFSGANMRIYAVKSEDKISKTWFAPIITFSNAVNVALFGHGALRDGPGINKGSIEVTGASNKVVITQVVPQRAQTQANGYTVADKTGALAGVSYPDCLSLFKRGVITAEDEEIMKHAHIGYASPPTEWTSTDVGAVAASGSAGYGSGIFTVRGAGEDIWGTADAFQFLHQTVSGDCEITARVLTLQNTGQFPKAGVMIRDSLDAGSKSAQMIVQGTAGNRFHCRTETNQAVAHYGDSNSTVPPLWVKVKRVGSSFTAYRSADGSNWDQVGSSVTIFMDGPVQIGLCVSSNNDGAVNAATFDNVSLTVSSETVAGSWHQYN